MIFKIIFTVIPLVLLFSFSAKQEKNTLIVSVDGHIVHYFFPIDMEESNNYSIQIPRVEFTEFKEIHNQVWSNKITDMQITNNKEKNIETINNMLKLANTEFNKKNYSESLKIITDALMIDPYNFVLITMKGSVHYKLGDYSSAIKYWNESLAVNPLQPNIIRYIEKAKSKGKGKNK